MSPPESPPASPTIGGGPTVEASPTLTRSGSWSNPQLWETQQLWGGAEVMVEGPDPECGLRDPNANWQVFISLDLDCYVRAGATVCVLVHTVL